MLVCPDCGNDEFTRDAPALLRITLEVDDTGLEIETGEEIVDTERDGEWSCTDCGTEYCNAAELVTEEAYNEAESEYEQSR